MLRSRPGAQHPVMRNLFSALTPQRSPLAALPRRGGSDASQQLRASLEGLEVRDSTWDEWLACQHAQAQTPPAPRAAAKAQ